ncbi:hypothetical protein L3X38_006978 [Prunus dulcis]|uniref:Uncharacterized protein n=1 Tax=Prunus dulcis TaxID=3755 RepID=A0AAD4ZTM5_PRUDU|nr:hypothetical protein L3X38_006978 [Prunus dulcis]
MVNLDNDANDITMPSPRPEGRDKQKAAKKKKGKMADPSQETRDKYLESLVEQGIVFKEDRRQKLIILDKFVQDQVDAYAYQKQQDKEAQEQKIMSMDVSKFTPRKKKYWGINKIKLCKNMHKVNSLPLILKITKGTIIQAPTMVVISLFLLGFMYGEFEVLCVFF